MKIILCMIVGYCGPTALAKAASGQVRPAYLYGAAAFLALLLYVQLKTGGIS